MQDLCTLGLVIAFLVVFILGLCALFNHASKAGQKQAQDEFFRPHRADQSGTKAGGDIVGRDKII